MTTETKRADHLPIEGEVSDGLARPGSVAWRINSEMVLLLGWGRAILLQFAHPLVAAGVAEHSLFVREPHGRARRLHQTVRAMLELTFGTMRQAQAAADGINRIHDVVHGELPEAAGPYPAGTRYSAHDPELLRWVQATLLDTLPRAYERFVGPLTMAEKDRYCLEASGLEPLLGVPAGYFPRSTAELCAYMDEMEAGGGIVVTETARRLAREVLRPPLPPLPKVIEAPARVLIWPLAWVAGLPTIGMLPPPIRAAYGFRWTPWHEIALAATSRLIRLVLPVAPSVLRFWPVARQAFRRCRHCNDSGGHGPAVSVPSTGH